VDGPDDYEELTTTVQDVPVPASLRRTKRPSVLEQVGGPGAPREFVLDLPELIIGRSPQANISIDDNGISRQHCAIRRAGPEFGFVDLNSANGVYLNTVKTHAAILREGDTLQLGDAVFLFHEGS
jgi:pSer/pThr/pTyr-binding forkhead associated (FHA) protein